MVTIHGSRTLFAGLLVAFALGFPERKEARSEPIGLMERYALAEDREAMLAELIPGSDDYYFYHCLHFQTSGRLERAESILRDWLAEKKGRETPLIAGMLDRQRLLTYNDSPQRTIDHLIRRLGVKLDHAPPVTKGQRRYPSKLDTATLDVDRLVKEALQRNDALKPVGLAHLAELFRSGKTAGVRLSLRDFLNRVSVPSIDRLDELVIKELNSRKATDRRFGDLKAHNFLTLKELRQVASQVPAVSDDNQFVAAILHRLRPNADSDPSQQEKVRLDYLQRVEAYVRTLPASYNSLKASAAFRLLEARLADGEFDRDLFLQYLKLPRISPIVHHEWARQESRKAKLTDNYMSLALLPPIGDEQPLVRMHLEHFLKDAENTDEFKPYLQPDYLRKVFAETKLLAGVGSEDQWYKMLSPSARQAIRDSVQLRLASQNPRRQPTDRVTELIVDVKNIDEMVIRIYEINTQSYYRTHTKAIDTDIDLDGLIATHEQRFTYRQPAVQRHREKIRLDQIEGRGVWIVDLVGKGVRARAMIRRGEIHHVDSSSADGMNFTILDENRDPIPAATMMVGSREFVADDQGRIVIPPVADRVSRRAIISDGQISRVINFRHLRETYSLTAGMHLDRTQLQSGGTAQLLIRPRVVMGNTPIDPKTLTDVSVRIEARDLENLATTKRVDSITLDQNAELVVPIRVPARLSSLSVTLSGKVDGLADGKQRTLQTSRSWDIAGIRKTSHTHDAFLTRDGDQYVIEVRGRNGELVPGATVSVTLSTDTRNAPVQQTLQCDETGTVQLFALPGVKQIRFGVPSGLQHTRDLDLNQVRWPAEIHTTVDRAIRLALPEDLDDLSKRYRLIATRDGSYQADQSDRLMGKDGMLVIDSLEPGDYQLLDRSTGRRVGIEVVDGRVIDQVAAGKTRHRSISPVRPLAVTSIKRDDEGVKIKLAGDTRAARVHVYASRFLDSIKPIDHLQLPLPRLTGRRITLPRCGYVSDLRLGDEYQYVLRRRYAKKYPGVMLPQPSVILNPWETQETTSQSQSARSGDVPPPSAAAPDAEAAMEAKAEAAGGARVGSSDYDFLADPGAMMTNLRPDEDGLVTIPADVIEGLPLVQVVVTDPATILQRTLTAPLKDAETIDLRLAKALDAAKPYSFERAVTIASKENPLDLKSLGSAQLQVYASVGGLMKLYKTLVNDPRMADFDSLAYWHKLDQPAKLSAYTRLASHELHLFLWAHDRGFFEEIVQPYLENKKEKQFIDHWLLQHDLKPYTTLWRYNQLNAAERVLLSMRLPESRAAVQRELREYVAQQDENFEQRRRSIDSALKGLGLELRDEDVTRELRFGFESAEVDGAADDPFGESPSLRVMQRAARAKEVAKKSAEKLRVQDGKDRFFGGRLGGGGRAASFFRDLDSTKQWAESHWDRVRTVGGPIPASLISIDPFWSDLANCQPENIQVSSHLLRPVQNRHAALVALALCGLSLDPREVGLPTESDEAYAPPQAVAVVTKRLKTLAEAQQESTVLVGQRFESLDGSRNNRTSQTVEPNEFVTGVAYRGQTVVSNPTAERRVVDIFWQIPAGSLPLSASQRTDSRTMVLDPFAVKAIEYQFYFPVAGQFVHYPATVSGDNRLLARGREKTFRVVEQPTEQDAITWEKVARTGTPKQIRDFLAEANLRQLNWMLVAHRMNDQGIYREIIDVLGEAKMPIADLWAYALKHRDEPAMVSFLSLRDDLVQRVGPVLDSPLLEVLPIERRTHELLEYAPLVRARIHRLGAENEILNPTFMKQYQSFVRMLGYSKGAPSDEQLVLAYYLLLQNRIEEAIRVFRKIDRDAIDTKMQYDYVAAYLGMHQEQFDRAEKIARSYLAHPIPRWQQRFRQMASQLNQRRDLNQTEQLVSVEKKDGDPKPIEEGSGDLAVMDRERRQESAAELQPEVIVRVEGDSLRIDHRRAKEVTINLYGVDLELLFSKAPFVREDLQRMAMVRPTRSEDVTFDQSTGVGRYDLDENLRRQTLLIEVVAGASRSTALYYGGEITTYVSESYGQLQTTDATSHRPIGTAYVKVYAKYPDGNVRFYKDGYTDPRGRFDYASISANDAKGAQRFAILVISDEKGATLHDVAAPTQ